MKIDEKKFHDLLFKVKNGKDITPPAPKPSSFKHASYAPEAAAAAAARSSRLRSALVSRSVRSNSDQSTATSGEQVPAESSQISSLASATKSRLRTWKDRILSRAHKSDNQHTDSQDSSGALETSGSKAEYQVGNAVTRENGDQVAERSSSETDK